MTWAEMDAAPIAAMPPHRLRYWQRVRRLTLGCLFTWFGLTFALIFYARELADITVLGWPLSFYMAAQGLTLIYVVIIGLYAWAMRRFDRQLRDELHDGQ